MSWLHPKPVVEKPKPPRYCQVCTGQRAMHGYLVCSKCYDAIGNIAARLACHTTMTYQEAVWALTTTLVDMPKRVEGR